MVITQYFFQNFRIQIKEFDLREGTTFTASRRAVKAVEEESEKIEKLNLKPALFADPITPTKKRFSKSASESKLKLVPKEDLLELTPKKNR